MPKYRSDIFKLAKMAGARSLWNATHRQYDPQRPIIAVVNSFSEFVPGHTHLQEVSRYICEEIYKAGGMPKEFNTIAIDDGIAMGHAGMLYSLPSRDLIADSVEYVVEAHCVDAMICISNCDKITPGMLMAAFRLNIPTVNVSGGPMEAGKAIIQGKEITLDLVDAIVAAADENIDPEDLEKYAQQSCPTCGSCSGMFTANSMNCLAEVLGLALPGNGSILATHKLRKLHFQASAAKIVEITKLYYEKNKIDVLPRSIGTKEAFENAMILDIAMGGSTNTVLHILALAHEAKVDFTLSDIDRLSRKTPNICKVAPASHYHMEDVHRAGGIFGILGELHRMSLLNPQRHIAGDSLEDLIKQYDVMLNSDAFIHKMYKAAPGGVKNLTYGSQENYYDSLDLDREKGCIREQAFAFSSDGGLAILYGNLAQEGCVVKTAGVSNNLLKFIGKAVVCESQEEAIDRILKGEVHKGDVVVIRYEGPKGGPGMQEMLYPTSYLKAMKLDQHCALITDGRFSGGTAGLSIGHISPEACEGGLIALVEEGDEIIIDIPQRKIHLNIPEDSLQQRQQEKKGIYRPKLRNRVVSSALQRYAYFVENASKGAVQKQIFRSEE